MIRSQEILDTLLHYLSVIGSQGNLTLIIILNKGFNNKVIQMLDKLNLGNQEAFELPNLIIDEIELEPIQV